MWRDSTKSRSLVIRGGGKEGIATRVLNFKEKKIIIPEGLLGRREGKRIRLTRHDSFAERRGGRSFTGKKEGAGWCPRGGEGDDFGPLPSEVFRGPGKCRRGGRGVTRGVILISQRKNAFAGNGIRGAKAYSRRIEEVKCRWRGGMREVKKGDVPFKKKGRKRGRPKGGKLRWQEKNSGFRRRNQAGPFFQQGEKRDKQQGRDLLLK